MPLATDRLLLRRPRLADAPELFGFLGDAEAMRYTLRFASLRDCRRHIAAHERQRRRVGCAPWVVSSRADEGRRIVGYGGLYEDPFDRDWGIEVGCFFAPWAWGRGYATELTRFCLDVARERLRLAEVAAFAHPDNVASRRVLEKAGFEVERFVLPMGRYLYRRRLAPQPPLRLSSGPNGIE
jgi:RimJ/RimL family protein N-acetyltransferase